ncbi:MAG: LapA family protein [Bacillota bacterium]|nr:LapA family protein [Bacillota bacterium]MDW7676438.1 LapA family protein [Bacillota bacterium]
MKKEDSGKSTESMKHVELWFLFAMMIIIAVTVFALTNASPVPVRFLIWTRELSLALLIFLSAAVGAVIAILLGFIKQMRNRKKYKIREKHMAEVEKENTSLKTQLVELEAKLKEALKEKSQQPASGQKAGDQTKPGLSPDDWADEPPQDDLPDFLNSKSSD